MSIKLKRINTNSVLNRNFYVNFVKKSKGILDTGK